MKFTLTKAYDVDYEATIEVNSLESLMRFINAKGDVIISPKNEYVPYPEIRICSKDDE